MTTTYYPQGVCSKQMDVTVENGIVEKVEIRGGCPGNIQGLMALVPGMEAEEAIRRMKGIRCGFKQSSCPDQLARAIEECLAKERA